MKRRVVSSRNLPIKSPLLLTLLAYMWMDYYGTPDVERGIVYAVLVIAWLGWLTELFFTESVDLFKEQAGPKEHKRPLMPDRIPSPPIPPEPPIRPFG